MKMNLIAAVSAIAILVSVPALAENTAAKTSVENKTTGSVSTDVERAWEDIKADTSETYENIKAVFIDDSEGSVAKNVEIDSRHTAAGMIGKPVYNGSKERVGTLKDIIVDAGGEARMIVVADGEFPGFDGKLVAFDYNVVFRQNAEGDLIAPISETTLDKAAEFSYDLKESGDSKVRVIPTNSYSVAALLDGQVINPQGENVAEIDNISFKNGRASQLIVGFDKVLGLGGKHAAIDYSDAKLVRTDGQLDFQLSASHAAQFEVYKKTAMN
ncbi:MAG TPA: PRC-barrel domain-containing protein [Alphaproteobacteria bacterium]|nr:PRC-barrel domain-containing protein [Alphaproteobacteria bacterium]